MYKILYKNCVIDVVRNPQFLRFLTTGRTAFTGRSSANGILGSDGKTVYSFVPTNRSDVKVVTIEQISLKEFSRLSSLLNSGVEVQLADPSVLASAINAKLKQLSIVCNNKITAGFSVLLSDGELYRFKLTTEDQLNLMSIENQLLAGAESVVYHASDMPCKFFTREDMLKVVRVYRKHVQYHTTYFNAAKQYIKSLNNIDKIQAFTYGTNINSTVKNTALRQILEDGVKP